MLHHAKRADWEPLVKCYFFERYAEKTKRETGKIIFLANVSTCLVVLTPLEYFVLGAKIFVPLLKTEWVIPNPID